MKFKVKVFRVTTNPGDLDCTDCFFTSYGADGCKLPSDVTCGENNTFRIATRKRTRKKKKINLSCSECRWEDGWEDD